MNTYSGKFEVSALDDDSFQCRLQCLFVYRTVFTFIDKKCCDYRKKAQHFFFYDVQSVEI